MNINYDYYKVFYYVALYNSFSKAAEKLNMNQPNVSRIIKNLEEETGAVLFARSNKGVELTDKGKSLFDKVKIAIESIEKAEQELSPSFEQEHGKISIGLSEISIREHFIPIMLSYHNLHPNISLSLTIFYSNSQAVAALKSGKIDMIIISDKEEQLPNNIVQHCLIETHFEAVCGSNYPQLINKDVSLEEFSKYSLITLKEGTGYRKIMDGFYKEHGVEMKADIEIASFDQSNTLITGNIGVSILPEDFTYASKYLNNVYHKVRLKEKIPTCWTCYLRRNDISMPKYFMDFESMILDYEKYVDKNINISY